MHIESPKVAKIETFGLFSRAFRYVFALSDPQKTTKEATDSRYNQVDSKVEIFGVVPYLVDIDSLLLFLLSHSGKHRLKDPQAIKRGSDDHTELERPQAVDHGRREETAEALKHCLHAEAVEAELAETILLHDE